MALDYFAKRFRKRRCVERSVNPIGLAPIICGNRRFQMREKPPPALRERKRKIAYAARREL
jgi:hypothetical protein